MVPESRRRKGLTRSYSPNYSRSGAERLQVMTLSSDEFIRRFLLHVLPRGFHRIRHYGLLAGSARKASLSLARQLLEVAEPPDDDTRADRTASGLHAHAAADAWSVAPLRFLFLIEIWIDN